MNPFANLDALMKTQGMSPEQIRQEITEQVSVPTSRETELRATPPDNEEILKAQARTKEAGESFATKSRNARLFAAGMKSAVSSGYSLYNTFDKGIPWMADMVGHAELCSYCWYARRP
jgi:hypothetical protein